MKTVTKAPNWTSNMTQMSWTKVPKNGMFTGYMTTCCLQRTKPGEMIVTIPARKNGALVTTTVIHSRCLHAFMGDVPQDVDVLEEKANKIIEQFKR